jgi:hypothetical protein
MHPLPIPTPPHTPAAASGNYSSLVAYQPPDYAHPSLIRASLAPLRRAAPAALPGPLRSLLCRIAVVSNWAGFYRDAPLPGAAHAAHVPCEELAATAFPVAVIFRPARGALALLTIGRYPAVWPRLAAQPGLAPGLW